MIFGFYADEICALGSCSSSIFKDAKCDDGEGGMAISFGRLWFVFFFQSLCFLFTMVLDWEGFLPF